ncbi:MAG: glycerol-3-phosphate dehydrogenase/oxidase [Deltaproteobacteria bacterium]|nr:glycerol-3-phosphate dehydrogenase/oxidase [Deltaproteobacteria bacterium]
MRSQAWAKLTASIYDIVVVGGGITGAGVALEASLCGLKVLLVEKADFASGTSSKSGKLIHGGMRYLEHGHFKLVFDACAERHNLATRIAPHIVKPTMFFVPNYKGYKTPRWAMMVGVYLYTALAIFRNIGSPRFFSNQEARAAETSLSPGGLRGAMGFYDCKAHDARLVIDTLKKAHELGADLLNYGTVTAIDLQGEVKCITIQDGISPRELTVKARSVINATGAWADEIIQLAGEQEFFNLHKAKGIHLLLKKERLNVANTIAWESPRDGRGLYLVPWHDTLLVGTTDNFCQKIDDAQEATSAEVDYLLEGLNKLFPQALLGREDVFFTYAGVRPLIGSNEGMKEDDLSRDFEVIVSPRGLVSIAGGKLTTYRLMAKSAVAKVARRLLGRRGFYNAPMVAISGGDFAPAQQETLIAAMAAAQRQDVGLTRRLFSRYGTNAQIILAKIADDPQLLKPVGTSSYLYAEVDYIVENEFIESISDVLLRRTALALCEEDNGIGVAAELARFIGQKCGWNEERINGDVASYRLTVTRARQCLQREKCPN